MPLIQCLWPSEAINQRKPVNYFFIHSLYSLFGYRKREKDIILYLFGILRCHFWVIDYMRKNIFALPLLFQERDKRKSFVLYEITVRLRCLVLMGCKIYFYFSVMTFTSIKSITINVSSIFIISCYII